MHHDLDLAAVESALVGGLAGPVRYLPETGSTNSDALDWAEEGAPEGAVVVAGYQSAGRGRWGRTWTAPPGRALLFSVVLRPVAGRAALLTTLAGCACCAGVRDTTGLQAGVRWPNDVIVAGKKVAGILVETRVLGSQMQAAVVGVGMNVSMEYADLGPDLADRATSIGIELERAGAVPPDRTALLVGILRALEARYSRWSSEGLLDEATALSVVLGRTVRLRRADGRAVEGTARALTATGALEIDTSDGIVVADSGEIERLVAP
jgi:BirA family biotin operon repressor/biotin-[acetyl-CoA-carboxylase] ligase